MIFFEFLYETSFSIFIFLVTENDQIWRRDCVKEDFVGCKKETLNNGTETWEVELCVCNEKFCNEKMGDLPTSSTTKTTTPEGIDSDNINEFNLNYIHGSIFWKEMIISKKTS